jgi:CTP:molybdopterin cytidylyltransferase MocA
MESPNVSRPPERAVAVLLAAGGGTRFHGPTHKLLAELRGKTVIEWSVDAALRSGLDVWVVTGQAEIPRDDRVTYLHNPRWASGQASSLHVAVTHARAAGVDALIVGLGDQPFVLPETWRALAGSTSPIAVATYEGRRGNPVLLASDVWPLLTTEGDEGARSLMRVRPDLVQEVPCAGSSADIDTLEDLARWNS